MSKAEYVGVCPSQANCQTGGYSCNKQSPSGKMHNFGAECANSESSEHKHQADIKILENEPREMNTAESSHAIDDKLHPISEDVTNKHLIPEDASRNSETGKFVCFEQNKSEKKLESGCGSVSCKPPEKFENLGSELVENKLVETCTPVSGCLASEQVCAPPELGNKSSSVEHLPLPAKDSINSPITEQLGPAPEYPAENSSLQQLGTPAEEVAKDSAHSGTRDGRTPKSLKKKYMLRSLVSSDRVLRSRSQEKPKAPESSRNLPNDSSNREENRNKRRTKKSGMKTREADEYSRIKAQVKYFLNRINYEQSLIAAYSGEGWKGLSLEKLKPEKELQRATSEILRRKLKIRDLFQRLDSLCAEGRFPESLFDSDGQIDSEDIFCAKCGSKDLSAENDIILCDGVCDRGFHQFCLEPPLQKEDIPPDNEGWLCPGCDCKLDCFDLLNESQGTNLAITDKWEKVFPEAAAGHNQDPNFGLPSEDSEDNDYNPEGSKSEEEDEGDESSSASSEFTSASDEMSTVPNAERFPGLPSDESGDDDYDPDAQDVNSNVMQESSSSDFTSDSEDLDAVLDDMSSGKDEGRIPANHLEGSDRQKYKLERRKKQSSNSELLSTLESNHGQGGSAHISGKRSGERLDYKRLYDEEYGDDSSHSSEDEDWTGNVSSHSSEDEKWSETVAPRKRRKTSGEVAVESPNGNALVNNSGTNTKENTLERRTQIKPNLVDGNPAKTHESSPTPGSGGRKSVYKRLGENVTQRLYESFKENQYPDRATKENLAKELDLSFKQVCKWFDNTRWSFSHSPSMNANLGKSTSKTSTPLPQANEKPVKQGPETRKSCSTCNGAQGENAPEGDTSVIKSCGINGKDNELATQERNAQKSITQPSRNTRRRGKMDHQALNPDSKLEEIQKLPENLPKVQDMQTGSRSLSRRRKSIT